MISRNLLGPILFFILMLTTFLESTDYSYAANPLAKRRQRRLIEEVDPESLVTQSLLPACQGIPVLNEKDYLKHKSYWDETVNSCRIKIDVIPKISFNEVLAGNIQEAENSAASYSGFLEEVGLKALSFLETNNKLTEVLYHCANGDKDWFESKKSLILTDGENDLYDFSKCSSLLGNLKSKIVSTRPKLRQLLALTSFEIGLNYNDIETRYDVNKKLKSSKGVIAPKMEKLNEVELQKARKSLRKKLLEIEQAWEKINPENLETSIKDKLIRVGLSLIGSTVEKKRDLFYGEKINEYSLENKTAYMEVLAKLPIMAFLKKKIPSNGEIAKAAQDLLSNGEAEKQKILDLLYEANNGRSRNSKSNAKEKITESYKANILVDFMKYGLVVNEVLTESPSYCGVATGLTNYLRHNQTKKNALLITGLLGGTALVATKGVILLSGTFLESLSGAALATYATLPVAGAIYLSEYQAYTSSKQRTFNAYETFEDGEPLVELEEYALSRRTLMISLALAGTGIDLWGAGLLKAGGALVGVNASARVLEKYSAKKTVAAILRQNGMDEQQISQTTKHLMNGSEIQVKEALDKVLRNNQVNPQEIAMIRLLLGSQVQVNGNSVRFLETFLSSLPTQAKQREIATENALNIFKQLDQTTLNSLSTGKKAKLIAMASRFKHMRAEKIIRIVKNWDEGVDGLLKVYQQAWDNLSKGQYSFMSDIAQREEMAFEAALDALMRQSPEFKYLPLAERQAQRTKMMDCSY